MDLRLNPLKLANPMASCLANLDQQTSSISNFEMEEVFWSRFARQLARGFASLRGFTHKYKNLEIVKVVLFATYEQDYAMGCIHADPVHSLFLLSN